MSTHIHIQGSSRPRDSLATAGDQRKEGTTVAKTTDYPSDLKFVSKFLRAMQILHRAGVDVNWFLQQIISNTTFRGKLVELATPPDYFKVPDVPDTVGVMALLRETFLEEYPYGTALPEELVGRYAHANGLRALMRGMLARDVSVLVSLYSVDGIVRSEQEIASRHNTTSVRVEQLAKRGREKMLANEQKRVFDTRLLLRKQVHDHPIEELNLTDRSRNCLRRGEINTIGQLLDMSDEDLLAITHFGQQQLEEVITRLTEHGLIPWPS